VNVLQRVRTWRLERRLAGPRLLTAFADANPRATFVEVGANDGEQHDHLRPFILGRDWTGVMVEPVPYVFERLSRNYAGVERVALENAAVGDRDGTLPFYHLVDAREDERAALPDWYDGIGSFSREALLSHAEHIPDIESRMVCAQVPVLTLESLCRRHGIERLDLLVIDAEGYDWEIVRAIDFEARRPQLLVYEHYHLRPDERSASAAHLRERGYETMEEGFDTFCLGTAAPEPLRAAWRELRPAVAGVSKHDELP
jgi:FkbM family methyltransferase